MGTRQQGRIIDWKDEKGFGFIAPEGGGQQVFVHIKSFRDRRHRPRVNERVTFELAADSQGRPRAEEVDYLGTSLRRSLPKLRGKRSLLLASVFLGFVNKAHDGHIGHAFIAVFGHGFIKIDQRFDHGVIGASAQAEQAR